MRGRAGTAASSLALLAGGVAIVVQCRAHHHIEDAVLGIGLALLVAWLVQRPHPVGRYLSSGLVLTGVGGALVLVRVTEQYGYDQAALLAGAALALLVAGETRQADARRAAICLLFVGLTDAALVLGPRHVDAPDLWRPFLEGWGFGILLVVYGLLTLGAAVLPSGSPGRRRR